MSIKKINANKEDENKKKVVNLSDKLFDKIYNLKSSDKPEMEIIPLDSN